MRVSIFIAIAWLCCGSLIAAPGGYRIFKDQQGRSIDAKVIRVSGEDVYIELADGRDLKTDFAIYSQPDQKYIRDWEYRALVKSGIFEVRFTNEVSNKRKSSAGGVQREDYTNAYGIVIKNEAYQDIENVRVEYLVLKFQDAVAAEKRSEGRQVRKKGELKVAKLAADAETELKTVAFKMLETKLEPGYVWLGGGQRKSKDHLDGIWVKIFVDGEEVYEIARPETMLRNEVW